MDYTQEQLDKFYDDALKRQGDDPATFGDVDPAIDEIVGEDSFYNDMVLPFVEGAKGLRNQVTQGLTFGYGDEIEGGLDTLANKLGFDSGGGFDNYTDNRNYRRGELENFEEDHPFLSIGAELGGSLIPGIGAVKGLGKLAEKGGNKVNRAYRSIYNNPKKSAIAGGAIGGAVYGIGDEGNSESNDIFDMSNMAVQGGIGGAAGAGFGLLAPTLTRSAKNLIDYGVNLTVGQSGGKIGNRVENMLSKYIPAVERNTQKSTRDLEDALEFETFMTYGNSRADDVGEILDDDVPDFVSDVQQRFTDRGLSKTDDEVAAMSKADQDKYWADVEAWTNESVPKKPNQDIPDQEIPEWVDDAILQDTLEGIRKFMKEPLNINEQSLSAKKRPVLKDFLGNELTNKLNPGTRRLMHDAIGPYNFPQKGTTSGGQDLGSAALLTGAPVLASIIGGVSGAAAVATPLLGMVSLSMLPRKLGRNIVYNVNKAAPYAGSVISEMFGDKENR